VKPVDVCPPIARGGGEENRYPTRPLGRVRTKIGGHVVADRLGKARRGDPDRGRSVLALDVREGLDEAFPPAENGGRLGEVLRGDVHRLAEVADNVAPHVGRTALRAVNEGDAAFDPAKCDARAERRAELARIPADAVERPDGAITISLWIASSRARTGGRETPNRARRRRVHLAREINHPLESASGIFRSWLWSQNAIPIL
jgi:hypothetical protein